MRSLIYSSAFLGTLVSAVVSCAEPISPKLFGDLRKMANPGTAHERLQPLIGQWAVTAAYRLTPSAKLASARGEAEHRWILGGRFVLQRIRLKARFQEFEGLGIWGYDNYSGRYVANWVDNFDSGISNIVGHWDDSAKSLVLDIESNDVRTKARAVHRSELHIPDPDRHTWTVFDHDPDAARPVVLIRLEFTRVSR